MRKDVILDHIFTLFSIYSTFVVDITNKHGLEIDDKMTAHSATRMEDVLFFRISIKLRWLI